MTIRTDEPTSYSEHNAAETEGLSKDDAHILQWCLENYAWSLAQHEQDWCEDAFIFYRHFRNYVTQRIDPDDYHTNIGVGLAYPIVKIMSSVLMSPWSSGKDLMRGIALDEPGTDRVDAATAYVNHQMVNRVPRAFSKFELCVESALGLGRGIIKPVIRWEPQVSVLKRMAVNMLEGFIPGGVQVGHKLGFQNQPMSRYFSFEYVDPFNWWSMGPSRWTEDQDTTFERSYMTTGSVHRRMASGEWNSHVLQDGHALGHDEYTMQRLNIDGSGGDQVKASDPAVRRPHRIIEIQGWVETSKRRNGNPVYEPRLVQILNERHLLKNIPLGTYNAKPGYIVFEPVQDPWNTRPIGQIEPIEQILLVINDLVNIGLDNGRKLIESSLLIDPDSTDQTEMYLGPGEQNWVRDPSRSVAPLPMKDLPASFYELIGFFNDLIQRISGVSDYFGGMNARNQDDVTQTARGMQMMNQQSQRRFRPWLNKMDHELYRPAATWIHETAKQRLKAPGEMIPLPQNTSSPFVRVGPDELDLMVEYTFNMKSLDATSARQRAEFQEMMGMVAQITQSPEFQMQGLMVDYHELTRILFDEYDRERDADKIIKHVQQMMMEGKLPTAMPGQSPAVAGAPSVPGQASPVTEAA